MVLTGRSTVACGLLARGGRRTSLSVNLSGPLLLDDRTRALLDLIAEGVETEAELDTLLDLGVELIQGFYLARSGWPWPEVRPAQDFGRAAARQAAILRRTPDESAIGGRS